MTSKTSTPRRALLALAPLAFTLAGCGSLIGPTNPPPQIYMLKPALGPVDAPSANWQLSVARPDGADVYDTQRIAIERNQMMDYYADAQWTDETEPLIQRALVEGFEKSGRMPAVGRDREGLHADVILQIEIRNFLARYDSESGAPIADVELVAKLVTPERRMVVGTFDSHHEAQATANSIPAAVAAFNTATSQAVEEIVAWSLKTGTGAVSASGTASSATAPARHRRHRRHR